MFALDRLEMPLGSGACSGTSLPIDRALVARLFAPWEPTRNALHTVGDWDFALDWTWGVARVVLALGRMATDVVDFSTSEFALVRLDGAIAAGSSMMPQKKNPDVFELVRGKSARAIGNVVALLTLMKGLASGYNRDQQEDRLPLLEAGPLARGCSRVCALALGHIEFDPQRGRLALNEGFTQATDLAEALVKRGVPFRDAYKAVGALVSMAVGEGVSLRSVDAARAQAIHPALDLDSLRVLDPATAVAAKESAEEPARARRTLRSPGCASEGAPCPSTRRGTARSVSLRSACSRNRWSSHDDEARLLEARRPHAGGGT